MVIKAERRSSNGSVFSQGVEFFDEKLNTLCMAWLIDHGESPLWGGLVRRPHLNFLKICSFSLYKEMRCTHPFFISPLHQVNIAVFLSIFCEPA